jgi:hypothetical protein
MPATRVLLETCGDRDFCKYLDEILLPGLLVNFAERSFSRFRLALQNALPKAKLEMPRSNFVPRSTTAGLASIEIRCRRDKSIKSVVRMKAKVESYSAELQRQAQATQDERSSSAGSNVGSSRSSSSTSTTSGSEAGLGDFPFASRIGDVLRASVTVDEAKDIHYVWEQLKVRVSSKCNNRPRSIQLLTAVCSLSALGS